MVKLSSGGFVVLTLLCLLKRGACNLKTEKILHKALLKGYNKDVLPEPGHESPVVLDFSMVMQQLSELSVKTQVLTLSSFVSLRWYDPQLTWKTEDMNGIDYIIMGSELIWTPDVVLYNTGSASSYFHTEIYKTKATIYNTGEVVWNAPVAWEVACSVDITWFPVDRQVCVLTFGSWTYPISSLVLDYHEPKMTEDHFLGGDFSVNNGEWEIEHVKSFAQNMTFKCCPKPFSTITYKMTLKRMSLYYFIYIILPLVSLLALFLLIFHISPEERASFGVTIILSATVYLLVISEKLPEKSDTHPMLGMMFIVEFYIMCLAVVTAAVTGLMSRQESRPPRHLMKCLTKLKIVAPVDGKANGETLKLKSNGGGEIEDDLSEENKDHNQTWKMIAGRLDRIQFIVYTVSLIGTPLLVVLGL